MQHRLAQQLKVLVVAAAALFGKAHLKAEGVRHSPAVQLLAGAGQNGLVAQQLVAQRPVLGEGLVGVGALVAQQHQGNEASPVLVELGQHQVGPFGLVQLAEGLIAGRTNHPGKLHKGDLPDVVPLHGGGKAAVVPELALAACRVRQNAAHVLFQKAPGLRVVQVHLLLADHTQVAGAVHNLQHCLFHRQHGFGPPFPALRAQRLF